MLPWEDEAYGQMRGAGPLRAVLEAVEQFQGRLGLLVRSVVHADGAQEQAEQTEAER